MTDQTTPAGTTGGFADTIAGQTGTRRMLLVWDAPNMDMGLGALLGGRPTAAHRPRFDALGRWLLQRTADVSALTENGGGVEPGCRIDDGSAGRRAAGGRPGVGGGAGAGGRYGHGDRVGVTRRRAGFDHARWSKNTAA